MAEFLSDTGKAALLDAVRDIEAKSAVEVLLAVRTHSGSYLHADAFAALIASSLTLAFALYSPWPVESHYILLDTILMACVAGWFSSRTPSVRRWLSPARHMQKAVEREARATFVDKGVCETSGRTGLLIYVSQLERELSVVSDRGVLSAVHDGSFRAGVQELRAQVAAGCDARGLANSMGALGKLLATALPRVVGDVNELSDEVQS